LTAHYDTGTRLAAQEIASQAFGGVEYIKQWDPAQNKEVVRTMFKQYSAYMLFYEVRALA
jgi:hypothetical protein